MRESRLVDSTHRPVSPDLFRVLARRWRPESVDVASLPGPDASLINEALAWDSTIPSIRWAGPWGTPWPPSPTAPR